MPEVVANPVPAVSVPAHMLPEDDLVPLPRFAIIKEHSYWTTPKQRPDGTVEPPRFVKIDKARLERIASRGNSRLYRTGDLAPIIPGHTDDVSPEENQPRIIGYAIDYTVEPLARDGKYAIWVTPLAKKDEIETFRKLRRRSSEYWENRDEIDPIALLGATTPEQDLGLHRFSASMAQFVRRYSRDEPSATIQCDDEETRDTPSKKEPSMADDLKKDKDMPTSGVADAPDKGSDGDPVVQAIMNSKWGKKIDAMMDLLEGMLGGGAEGAGPGGDPLADAGAPGAGAPGIMPSMPPQQIGGEPPPSPLAGHPDRLNMGSPPGPGNTSTPDMPPSRYSRGYGYDFGAPAYDPFGAPAYDPFGEPAYQPQASEDVIRLSRKVAEYEERAKRAEFAAAEAQKQMAQFSEKFARDARRDSLRAPFETLAQTKEFDLAKEIEAAVDMNDQAVIARMDEIKRFHRDKTPGFGSAPARPEQQQPVRFQAGVGGASPVTMAPMPAPMQHDIAVEASRVFHNPANAGKFASPDEVLAQMVGARMNGGGMNGVTQVR